MPVGCHSAHALEQKYCPPLEIASLSVVTQTQEGQAHFTSFTAVMGLSPHFFGYLYLYMNIHSIISQENVMELNKKVSKL